jgi:hypothetical protein
MNDLLHYSKPNPGQPLLAVKEVFEDVEVIVTRTRDAMKCVAWPSINEGCRGWSGASTLFNEAFPLLVVLDGREQVIMFVSREVFLGSALISHRFPRFRQFVVKMLEQLEDVGVVTAPDVADDPLVLRAAQMLETAIRVARVERQSLEIARRQEALEQSQLALVQEQSETRRIAEQADAKHANSEFLYAAPWLKGQGVRLPETGNWEAIVGREIAEIARAHGYDTRKLKKGPNRGFMTLQWPPDKLIRFGGMWIDLNRRRFDRRELFIDGR